MKMKGKINILFILILINPVLAYATSTTYRPNDSIGAPENNRDSLYMTQTGEVRDFSLSIPIINTEFDVIGAIAFRDVNISRFTAINQANLSLNFQLEYLTSSEPLMITIYGYASSLGNGTFNEISTSIPLTSAHVNVNLQNVTSPGFYLVEITDVIWETINKEYWENGDTLGIIIYSGSQSVARSYQSNYGINRPKLAIRYGETDYSPEEETDYIGSYKGYDVFRTNSTVVYYGLDNPDYWVPMPISFVVSGNTVTQEDPDIFDSVYIPNGDYGEVWGSEVDENGNYYDVLYETTLWNGETGVSALNSVEGTFDDSHDTKVGLFGFERVHGTVFSGTVGYIGGIGVKASMSWMMRYSNNKPMAACALVGYNETHIRVYGAQVLGVGVNNGEVMLKEGNVYLFRYRLGGFAPKSISWGGSLYNSVYDVDFFHLNETNGVVTSVGGFQRYMNHSSAVDCYELIECHGSGTTNCMVDFYVTRGWSPARPYDNAVYIYQNGTLIEELPDLNITEIQDWIDENLLEGGTTDDPSPGGWEDEGPFKRSSLRLYLFLFGWGCFWLPWFYVAQASGLRRIMSFWVALMISLIGLALLWAIPGI